MIEPYYIECAEHIHLDGTGWRVSIARWFLRRARIRVSTYQIAGQGAGVDTRMNWAARLLAWFGAIG